MKDNCKLLIITDNYVGVPGGSERHLYNFLSGLSDNFEADVFQMIPTGNPMLEDGVFRGNSSITLNSHPMGKILSFNYLVFMYKLVKRIRSHKIDVIISYHEKSDISNFLIKKLFGKRIISISSKRDLGFKLNGRLRQLIKYITPKFDAVTAPSNSIKEWLIDDFKLDKDNIHVIKNGVDLSSYPVITENEKLLIKSQLNIPQVSRLMTSVGSLKSVKGHKYLLQSFATFLQRSKDDWLLVLLGDGELRGELESQAHELRIQGSVLFTGYQTNVPKWLLASDLMVSATLSEGLSNALIEGCAAGCPVVATNVGGNPEIVRHGYNGLLVESESPEEMSEALIKLTESESLQGVMSVNSRNQALTEFSNTSMVDSLEALYLGYKNRKDMSLAHI
jgi:glycosyltransferase involved in cell wall biosynthesis